ncbi:hypothetical protein BKG95_02380 [Rodentibacter pneumotropicus]|uniref:Uncharacterized protein n=1 Tax=Rodentibacter pneumotropicus TaxID=758 RepID=A0A1V3K7T9_9PAST|nr:hypothetical protein [Rodentibacter pneumotropicus]MCQ9120962.1 hypothetical protein [Rodentibacter pneumotropicus]OOF69132.1 hypothetical protein BKG95_02380 [Rodentibacter pneumotropicus]VEH67281.1 Uncharacterised protein [Rodentibacter pneumotropicus]
MSEIKIRVSTHDNDTTDIDLSRNGTMLKVSLGDKKAEIDIAEFIPATMADRFLAEATYDEVTKALILTTRKEGEEDKEFRIPIGDIFKQEQEIIQIYKLSANTPKEKRQAVPFEVPSELAGKPVYIAMHRMAIRDGEKRYLDQATGNITFTPELTLEDLQTLAKDLYAKSLSKHDGLEYQTVVKYTPVEVKEIEVEYVPTPASVTLEETASGIHFTLAGVNEEGIGAPFSVATQFYLNNLNYNNQLSEDGLAATEVTPYGLGYIAKYVSSNTLISFADSITFSFEIPLEFGNEQVKLTLPMVSENGGFRTFKVEAETFDELREKYKTQE